VELDEDRDGALRRVHELDRAAGLQSISRMCRPGGDPLSQLQFDHRGSCHRDRMRLDLEPGERADFTVRLDPAEEQKPGDAYAFDVITADAVTGQPFGAARVYVLVS
jgi:hypothetical protein